MSHSVLRTLVRQIDSSRLAKQHSIQLSAVNTDQLQPQKAKDYISEQFANDFPGNLREQIESIYRDTLELSQEQFNQQALLQDMERFNLIQQNLQAPLRSRQNGQFYAQIVSIFKSAAEGQIKHFKNPLQFVRQGLLDLLSSDAMHQYLYLIVDFYIKQQVNAQLKGIEYLISLFQSQNFKNYLQKSINNSQVNVSTQLSYYQTFVHSKFEKPFYQFLTGQTVQNDCNFTNLEQNLVICLNELTLNNYILSASSYDKLQNCKNSKDTINLTKSKTFNTSKTQFDQSDDLYFQLINSLFFGKDFSKTQLEQLKDAVQTPFVIQAFFRIIKDRNKTLFNQDMNQGQSNAIVQRNTDLFVLALQSDIPSVLEHMQSHGMFVEIFILGYYVQKDIVAGCYLPGQVGDVEVSLLKDVVDENLHFSVSQSLMVVPCYLQAVKLLQDEVVAQDVPLGLFALFGEQRFQTLADVLTSFVCFIKFSHRYEHSIYQSIRDQLDVEQKYIFALLLQLGGFSQQAFQVNCQILEQVHQECYVRNQFDVNRNVDRTLMQISESVVQNTLTTSQQLLIDKLLQPRDIQEFQRQLTIVNSQFKTVFTARPDAVCMRQQALDMLLVQLVIYYHSGNGRQIGVLYDQVLDELINQQQTVGLSQVYLENINQLMRMLLLVSIRYQIGKEKVRTFANRFQGTLNDQNKELVLQLQ